MLYAALERLALAERQGWSSQDLVETLSPRFMRRFELFRAQAARGTMTTSLIVERADVGVLVARPAPRVVLVRHGLPHEGPCVGRGREGRERQRAVRAGLTGRPLMLDGGSGSLNEAGPCGWR